MPIPNFCGRTRREFLWQSGCGFGGVARRPGGVCLQGVAGARSLGLWLSGGRDDDDFVLLLRQLVRGSYKGHLGPETDVTASAVPSGPIGMAGTGGD